MTLRDPARTAETIVTGLPSEHSIFMLEQILRQVSDNLSNINKNQAKMGEDLQEANIRIAKIETREERSTEIRLKMEHFEVELDKLSNKGVQNDAHKSVFNYFIQNWSGVAGIIALGVIAIKSFH